MKLQFEMNYFNKKTFCQEHLIEPYSMQFTVSQEKPVSQAETCISSVDMLDINLTYGCILSIQDTLDLIKKDEAEVVRELRDKKTSPFDGILDRISETEAPR